MATFNNTSHAVSDLKGTGIWGEGAKESEGIISPAPNDLTTLELTTPQRAEVEQNIAILVNSGQEELADDISLRGIAIPFDAFFRAKFEEKKLEKKLAQDDGDFSIEADRREEKKREKEEQAEKLRDDAAEMSEAKWLETETEFAGITKTGKEWRDFAKLNREFREESDAYALRMGATRENIELANKAIDAMGVAPSERTDEQDHDIYVGKYNPEVAKAIQYKNEMINKNTLSNKTENSIKTSSAEIKSRNVDNESRAEYRSDYTGNESLIKTDISAKRDFSTVASATPAEIENTPQQKTASPSYKIGGMDFS